jgi:MYXO-CTERM domain-containing protein
MRPNLLVTVTVLLGVSAAWAMPTPCTEQELMDQSDLVVDAECIAVVCEGPPVEESDKIVTTYRSTLVPSKSYKGTMPGSFEILGSSHVWKGPPPSGYWGQPPVARGWVGKLYLELQASGGTYVYTCWNGSEEDTTQSQPEPLPTCAAGDGGASDAIAADGTLSDSGPGGDTSLPPPDDDGCSCAVDRAAPGGRPLPLALLLGLLAMLRRGRSQRRG